MAGKGFRVDHTGFTRYATGRSVKRHMRFVGEHWQGEVAEYARRTFRRNSGEYINSLSVDFNDRILGKPTPLKRTGVVVVAKVRYAAALEYGNAVAGKESMPRPLTHVLDRMHAADPRQGKRRG